MDSDEELLWPIQPNFETLSWLDEEGLFEDEPEDANTGPEFPSFSDQDVDSSDAARFAI
jgi:hypothetical protein